MDNTYDICIIGGGAAGLTAAIAAGRASRQAGISARIGILESSDRVGRSILKTGNGRCNFTNEHAVDDPYAVGYYNPAFVHDAYQALGAALPGSAECAPDPVLGFFEGIGLAWRQEADGRRYPLANKASVVVDVLRAACAFEGVEEVCNAEVMAIEVHESGNTRFMLRLADGRLVHARAVIVACGGAVEACAPEGIPVNKMHAVLGPIACCTKDQAITRQLDNIRIKCDVQLMREQDGAYECIGAQTGELLFRPYGLSGICIFDLSRLAQPGDAIRIGLLQGKTPEQAHEYVQARHKGLAETFGTVDYGCLLRGLVLSRIADVLLDLADLDEQDPVDDAGRDTLASLLGGLSFTVEGMGPVEQCQVQRGGFTVEAFNPTTMEAHAIPGLFAAGEALDVEGPCGGYNLHWAWGSGLLAGTTCAKLLA